MGGVVGDAIGSASINARAFEQRLDDPAEYSERAVTSAGKVVYTKGLDSEYPDMLGGVLQNSRRQMLGLSISPIR